MLFSGIFRTWCIVSDIRISWRMCIEGVVEFGVAREDGALFESGSPFQ